MHALLPPPQYCQQHQQHGAEGSEAQLTRFLRRLGVDSAERFLLLPGICDAQQDCVSGLLVRCTRSLALKQLQLDALTRSIPEMVQPLRSWTYCADVHGLELNFHCSDAIGTAIPRDYTSGGRCNEIFQLCSRSIALIVIPCAVKILAGESGTGGTPRCNSLLRSTQEFLSAKVRAQI